MGSGSSRKVPPPDTSPDNNNKVTTNSVVTKGGGGGQAGQNKDVESEPQIHPPVPKAIVFDIPLEDPHKAGIIKKHPPKRLQRLAPLENAPHITAEMLEEKLKHAEQKRLEELERVKGSSRKMSRVQRNIFMAKKFEEDKQRMTQIENKLKAAEKHRELKLKEIEEKQQLREERAQRIRARGQRLREGDDLDFEIENDETFNEDDDGYSWLISETTDLGTRLLTPLKGDEWQRQKSEGEISDWEKGADKWQMSGTNRVGKVNRTTGDTTYDDGFFD